MKAEPTFLIKIRGNKLKKMIVALKYASEFDCLELETIDDLNKIDVIWEAVKRFSSSELKRRLGFNVNQANKY